MIFAVGPEAVVDPTGFAAAVARAQKRALANYVSAKRAPRHLTRAARDRASVRAVDDGAVRVSTAVSKRSLS